MKEFTKIQNILVQSGMSEQEAEEHIIQLLEEEADFYLQCKNALAPLNKLSKEEKENLIKFVKEENKKRYN